MNHNQTGAHRRIEPTGFDAPYTFGRPASTYLAPRVIVRLTILRSRVRDSRLQFGPTEATPQVEQPQPATE